MSAEKKDFYKITELTDHINKSVYAMAELVKQPTISADSRNQIHLTLLLLSIQVNLAIAQQLTMVSQRLGSIVDKGEN